MDFKRKFTAIILIILLLIVPMKKAQAVAPALGPAIYWGIGSLIVSSGVYASTNEDLQYLVNDYWDNASNSIKNMWRQTAIYGGIAGYLLVNEGMIGDMKDYLINKKEFLSGQNIITKGNIDNPAIPSVKYIALGGYTLGVGYNATNSYYYTAIYLDGVLEGGYGDKFQTYADAYSTIGDTFYLYIQNDYIFLRLIKNGSVHILLQGPFSGESGTNSIEEYNYTGDAAGIGSALSPEREIKVPCPPIPDVEWDPGWINDLEKELNQTNNPDISDQTKIDEGNHEWDWYVDEHGNIYRVKKGEPPKDPQKDRQIGFPVPLPEPNVPDHFPDINNPDETVINYPPETTSTENPDGTRTDTTTETTTTTRRWYDPTTERWKETTTTTTTTTQQDYDPDGLPLGPPVTTTTTAPPTTTTTTPPTDDDTINFEPLKKLPHFITTRFPFSLPWDLKRGIESLAGSEWDRKFTIPAIGDYWPAMEIDISMFDNIASMTRVILLIVFDFGLIFATRRLMGGDV